MSDKKQTLPCRALLVKANYERAGNYMDAMSIVSVEVLSVIDGQAACRFREGSALRVHAYPVSSLASTPEKAVALVAKHFAALLSRAVLQPVPVKTESTAAETLTVSDQGARTGAASHVKTS